MVGRLPKNIYGAIDIQAFAHFGDTHPFNQRPFPENEDESTANFDLFQAWIKMDSIGGTNSELILQRADPRLHQGRLRPRVPPR